ncbi:MAG: hypothetical protein ABSG43_22915 [Solirubrobacteraceae bacterium]|jgi:hypothetical protein
MKISDDVRALDEPGGGIESDDLADRDPLDEVEALICDLAALVDAGLVVVREQRGGPARFAPCAAP